MTANWMEIAKVLQGGNLVAQLSQGDVASKEVLYHKSKLKCCYQRYGKRYINALKDEDGKSEERSKERWFKIHCLNKVIHYIRQTENENLGCIFEVKHLGAIHIEILQSYGYSTESHVS